MHIVTEYCNLIDAKDSCAMYKPTLTISPDPLPFAEWVWERDYNHRIYYNILNPVEILELAEGTEEAVFLRLDGVSMPKLVTSFTCPGVESPCDSVNPPYTHVHVLNRIHYF